MPNISYRPRESEFAEFFIYILIPKLMAQRQMGFKLGGIN